MVIVPMSEIILVVVPMPASMAVIGTTQGLERLGYVAHFSTQAE